ncbi:hypothetical protein A9264_07405 [Vibrio sp. UCD-FRSSP16_10]|uniref:hypothetical protein n=1 Tax=unclassified Vibrio TaxID=2614977 RepID=UPI0007FDF94B|nr:MULTISPECIES: hypothetical protein [unclassified Vibrio]OBT13482.1 hypothetical protein A9264_07405 [Vibrio sp. UCD-FRSSP16_10]OBT17991.1 hypothetical protein A9260_01395 [Vibrio sp. UCD-FRSSP16_30]
MHNQSRIEVWYNVGTEQILLGEVEHSDQINLLALWRSISIFNPGVLSQQEVTHPIESASYQLKLFGDDGNLMGNKQVCELDAESVLGHHHWMVCQSRNQFSDADSLYTWVPVLAG